MLLHSLPSELQVYGVEVAGQMGGRGGIILPFFEDFFLLMFYCNLQKKILHTNIHINTAIEESLKKKNYMLID